MNDTKFAPWITDKEIVKICTLLGSARLVGGCVRDYLLFGRLVDDIDIATELLPERVFEVLSPHFSVIPTGLKHGTLTIFGNRKYEITTLRRDLETDGRFAKVDFNASWLEDSSRRDFTMNALYSDIDGNLFDFHGGLLDLAASKVRFIGDAKKRISEDYLRIMRFFRFVSRFGNYDLDSIGEINSMLDGLLNISFERVTMELFKIFEGRFFLENLNIMLAAFDLLKFNMSFLDRVDAGISPLGMISVFWSPSAHLKLSNKEKSYVLNMQNLPLRHDRDAFIYRNKYGANFLNDKMIFEKRFFDLPDDIVFPISGKDLQHIFTGTHLGVVINRLYKIWARYLGRVSKEELLKIAVKML
jgi:poly(A) polymerase